jgi:putative transcriptional regulator
MRASLPSSLAGHFLIAMPSLADAPFSRGVALLCQHDEDGAVGLLINQLSEYRMGDILDQMRLDCADPELADAPVLIGGPVQQERGFVLHREHGHWESSFRVNDIWSITTSRDILVAMAAGEGPRHALLALGYSGWGVASSSRSSRTTAGSPWKRTTASSSTRRWKSAGAPPPA